MGKTKSRCGKTSRKRQRFIHKWKLYGKCTTDSWNGSSDKKKSADFSVCKPLDRNQIRENKIEILKQMEKRWGKMSALICLLLFNWASNVSSLSVTVSEMECVYEYVLYEGDTISGNFVVVDHEIFWSSDHPGIDFTVS